MKRGTNVKTTINGPKLIAPGADARAREGGREGEREGENPTSARATFKNDRRLALISKEKGRARFHSLALSLSPSLFLQLAHTQHHHHGDSPPPRPNLLGRGRLSLRRHRLGNPRRRPWRRRCPFDRHRHGRAALGLGLRRGANGRGARHGRRESEENANARGKRRRERERGD